MSFCCDCSNEKKSKRSKRCWSCSAKKRQLKKYGKIKKKYDKCFSCKNDKNCNTSKYCLECSLEFRNKKKWTPGRIAIFKILYGKTSMSVKKISEHLGISQVAAYSKAMNLRIKRECHWIEFPIEVQPFCLCGCGQRVGINKHKHERGWNKYITGHNSITHTDEMKKKMSDLMMGEKNPNWKGGVSYLNRGYRGPNWEKQRIKAVNRDKYICRLCQKFGKSVHHIIDFIKFDDYKEANELDNLMTLCRKCHGKFNKKKFTITMPVTTNPISIPKTNIITPQHNLH